MTQAEPSTDQISSFQGIALALASENPENMLPCPSCGASVRGKNLDSHVRKKHGVTQSTSSGPDANMRLEGPDRSGLLIWLSFVVTIALMVVPLFLGVGDEWKASIPGKIYMGGALVMIFFPFLVIELSRRGVFRARLLLGPNSVKLRAALGMLRREVGPKLRVEVGGLAKSSRMHSDGGGGATGFGEIIMPVGNYLRLGGGLGITIGCSQVSDFRSQWDQSTWRRGKRRFSCHIWLDQASFAELQYWLVHRSVLRPRKTD